MKNMMCLVVLAASMTLCLPLGANERPQEITQEIPEEMVQSTVNTFVDHIFKHHGPAGILGRTWPTGIMVLWVAILLGLYLMVYYI